MKVTFIIPPEEYFIESYVTKKLDKGREFRQKLGILWVAGYLRQELGITPTIIDGIWYIIVAIIVTSYGLKEFFQEKQLAIQKISGSLLIIISISLLFNLFKS